MARLPLAALLLSLLRASAWAAEPEPARVLAGFSLGLSSKAVGRDLRPKDVSAAYPGTLAPGEKVLSLEPLPKGAAVVIGRFYEDTLWRLEVGYAEAYAAKVSWGEFLNRPSALYGLGRFEQNTEDGGLSTSEIWESTATRLIYERFEKDGARGPIYRVVLEDLPALQYLEARTLEHAAPIEPKPAPSRLCADYLDCISQGVERLSKDDCAGAQPFLEFALQLDPELPDAYLHRSVMYKRVGKTALSRRDFARAVELGPALKAQGDGEGGPFTRFGPCKTRPDAAPKAHAETVDLEGSAISTASAPILLSSVSAAELSRPDGSKLEYYFLPPQRGAYPLALYLDGASCASITKALDALHPLVQQGIGVLAPEKRGVKAEDDGKNCSKEYLKNSGRGPRLADAVLLAQRARALFPSWDGRLIVIGASEGGALAPEAAAAYGQAAAVVSLGGGGWSPGAWPPIEAPLYIANGTEDRAFPVSASDAVEARFKALNKSNLTYKRYDGLDRRWSDVQGKDHSAEVLGDLMDWLRDHFPAH